MGWAFVAPGRFPSRHFFSGLVRENKRQKKKRRSADRPFAVSCFRFCFYRTAAAVFSGAFSAALTLNLAEGVMVDLATLSVTVTAN